MMKSVKRTIGLILISLMLLSNFAIPMKADASESTMPEQIDYDNENYEIAAYWEDRIAPTKPGYVFGGWYTKNDTKYTPIREAEIVDKGVEAFEGAYAKFVPAYVLSVKAQLQKTTEDDATRGDSTFLRVISAVDSTQYKNVGFDVLFNKKTPFSDEENKKTVITTVYESLKNDEGEIFATEEFGSPATHFSVLKINSIKAKNYTKVIYVTPYWTTMDGTKVEGISKYVRVMDGYTSHKYISIPVNLLTGDAVAAGRVQMEYDYKTLRYIGYDAGVVLPKMEAHVDESNGVIKFVGNATVGENNQYEEVEPESGIYANVWFQKKSDAEISEAGATVPERWEFFMSNLSFCDWNENWVTNVKAWDTRY